MYHIACTDEIPPMPSQLSGVAHDFLKLCFRRDPLLRPNVTKLLLHPFVATTSTPLLHQATRPAVFGGTVTGTSAAGGFYLPPRPATGAGGREHHRLLVPPEHPTYHPIEEDPEGRTRSTAARRAGRSGAGGGDVARGGAGGGLGHLGVEVLVAVGGGRPAAVNSPLAAGGAPLHQQSLPTLTDAATAAAQLAAVAPSLVASSAWQLGGNVLDTLQASPRALTADSAGGGARPSTSGSAFVKVRPSAAGGSGLGSPGRASQAPSSPSYSPTGEASERLVPAQIPHSTSIASELGDGPPPEAQWGVDAIPFPVAETAAAGDETAPPFPATPTFTSPEPAPPYVPEPPHNTLPGADPEPSGASASPVMSASAPPSHSEFSPAGSPDDFDEEAAFAKSAELSTDALQVENAAILEHITSAALSLSRTDRLHQQQQSLHPPASPASVQPADPGGAPGMSSPALSAAEQDARSQSSAAGTGGTRSNARGTAAADTGALPLLPTVRSGGVRIHVGASAIAATPSPFPMPPFPALNDPAPTALPLGALRIPRLGAASRADPVSEDSPAAAIESSALDAAPLSSARRPNGRMAASDSAQAHMTPDTGGALRAGQLRHEESPPLSMASSATPSLALRASSPRSSGGVSDVAPRDMSTRVARSSAPTSAAAEADDAAARAPGSSGTGDSTARRVGSSWRQYARYSDLDVQPSDVAATSPTAGLGTAERIPPRSEMGHAARQGSGTSLIGGQRVAGMQIREYPPSSTPASPTHRRTPSTQTVPPGTSSVGVVVGAAVVSQADASASASPGAGYASDASSTAARLQSQAFAAATSPGVATQDGGRPRLAEVPEHYARYEGVVIASPVKRASAAAATSGATVAASGDDSLQARYPSRIPRISTNYGRTKSTSSVLATGGSVSAIGAVAADSPDVAPALLLPASESTSLSSSHRPVLRSESFNRGQVQRSRGQYARPSRDATPTKGASMAPDAAAAGSAARPGSRGVLPPTPPTALQSLLASGDFPYEHAEGAWTVQQGEHAAAAPADALPATVASTLSMVRAKSGGYNRSKGRGHAAASSATATAQGLHPPRSAAPRRIAREGGVYDAEEAGGADDTPGMALAWTAASASLHNPQSSAQPPHDRGRAVAAGSVRPLQQQQPLVRGAVNRARSRTDELSWGPELPSVEPERLQLQPPFQALVDAPIAAAQSRGGGQGLRFASAAAWDSSPITWPPTQPAHEQPPPSMTVPVGTLASAAFAPPPGLEPTMAKPAATQQHSARRGVGGTAVVVGIPATSAPRASALTAGNVSGGAAPAATASRGGAAPSRTPASDAAAAAAVVGGALPGAGLPVFRSARDSSGPAASLGPGASLGLMAVGQSSHQHSRQATATAAPGASSGGAGWGAPAQPHAAHSTPSGSGIVVSHVVHSNSFLPQPAPDEAAYVIRSSPVRILDQRGAAASGGGSGFASLRQQAPTAPVATAAPGVAASGAGGGAQGLIVSGGGLLPGSGGVASFRQVMPGPSLSPIIPERSAAAGAASAGGAGVAAVPWTRAAAFAGTPDVEARALTVPSRSGDEHDGFYFGGGGGAGLGASADGVGGSGDSESQDYGVLPSLSAAVGRAAGGAATGAGGGDGGGGGGGISLPFPFLFPGGGSFHQPFPGPGAVAPFPAESPAEPPPLQPQPPPPQHAGFRGVASPRLSLVSAGLAGGGGGAAATSAAAVSGPGTGRTQQTASGAPASRLRGSVPAGAPATGMQPPLASEAPQAASGGGSSRRPAATFYTYGGATAPSPQSPGSTDWEAH